MASVSSGRSPATAGSRLVILVAFSACAGTSTLTTSPAPAAGSASMAPGRTVITGVSPGAWASTVNAPPKMRVDAHCAFFDLDDVDQQAGADARGQPAGDLLAVGGGGQQHARRGGGLGQRGQHVHVRGDQVVARRRRTRRRRSWRRRPPSARRSAAAAVPGLPTTTADGLAQRAGGGDQFGGDLLQRAIGVLDEHKYFSHVSSFVFRCLWVGSG